MALCEILKIKRPDGSKEEKAFVETLKKTLPNAISDTYGNIHVEVEAKVGDLKPRILFSSHTDTVHGEGGKQQVLIDEITSEAFISDKGSKGKKAFGSCLGADDGTGVWIMVGMIAAEVPGYYIFHRAEENGGKGSAFVRDNWLDIFRDKDPFDIAIAFDRKGTDEIITHQRGMRCASDTSAKQLQSQLGKRGLPYVPSDRGTFTDTANYSELVPECYNLSVGYDKQHGPNETQDLEFAVRLRKALCEVDWSALKAYRDPTKKEPKAWGYGGYGGHGGYDSYTRPAPKKKKPNKSVPVERIPTQADTNLLVEFVTKYPLAVMLLLHDSGISEDDIVEYVQRTDASPEEGPISDLATGISPM